MTKNKLITLRVYFYMSRVIRGNDEILTINTEKFVNVIMGNLNYYLSLETRKFFPQECITNPQQIKCISNFVLNIEFSDFNITEIMGRDIVGSINLVAK